MSAKILKLPLAEGLGRELDRLDLNRGRDDPLDEVQRIQLKQQCCRDYADRHPDDLQALRTAFDCATSAARSSAPYTLIGAKVLSGARKGHEREHGATAKKLKRWSVLQDCVDGLREKFPNYSHNKLCEIAFLEIGVPAITIRARTK